MEFSRFVWAFWWLIFPIMGFAFGAFRHWLHYRRQRDAIALMKTYAASGRDAPPEVLAVLREVASDPDKPDPKWTKTLGLWFPGLIMLGVAAAFAVLRLFPQFADRSGFLFVSVFLGIFGGTFLIADRIAAARAKRLPDGDADGR